MPILLVVGGGLFGSLAAALRAKKGVEAVVFDPALEDAASPAAAGLFKEEWAGERLREHYSRALPLLEQLYGVRHVSLTREDGSKEGLLFVPPAAILEPDPVRQVVTAVGDGFLEADGQRHEGWVYVAAGAWCEQLLPCPGLHSRTGAALFFRGEREGRSRTLGRGRQAQAFTRDPGMTYFSDGTAERQYTPEHDRLTRERAAEFGLVEPVVCLAGRRPYTPGGPVFRKVGRRTWLATGGRKMGTVLGASYARRLVEEELAGSIS